MLIASGHMASETLKLSMNSSGSIEQNRAHHFVQSESLTSFSADLFALVLSCSGLTISKATSIESGTATFQVEFYRAVCPKAHRWSQGSWMRIWRLSSIPPSRHRMQPAFVPHHIAHHSHCSHSPHSTAAHPQCIRASPIIIIIIIISTTSRFLHTALQLPHFTCISTDPCLPWPRRGGAQNHRRFATVAVALLVPALPAS